MNAGHQRFGLFLEPARDGSDSSRVLEHVTEEWFCYADSPRQPHVGSVKSRHQRDVRESAYPGANDSIGKPPVRVDDLRLEIAARPHRMDEVRAEETDERQLRGP